MILAFLGFVLGVLAFFARLLFAVVVGLVAACFLGPWGGLGAGIWFMAWALRH